MSAEKRNIDWAWPFSLYLTHTINYTHYRLAACHSPSLYPYLPLSLQTAVPHPDQPAAGRRMRRLHHHTQALQQTLHHSLGCRAWVINLIIHKYKYVSFSAVYFVHGYSFLFTSKGGSSATVGSIIIVFDFDAQVLSIWANSNRT